jgi:hypothetical protein
MDTNIRKPLQAALSRLHTDRERIEKQIAAIETVLSLDDQPATNGRARTSSRRTRKGMTAAARQAVSKRMKAYWAKKRKVKGRRKAA